MLTKYYQLNFLKPKLHSVPLTDGSVATVPIFNVKDLLIAFLNDPLRMRQENFTSNYDICWVKGLQLETGCPVEDYFKLWVSKAEVMSSWKTKKKQSSKSMRPHGSKFGVKTRPQNCQKLENVFGKIEIFLAQNSIFLAQNSIFFNGFPISKKSEKIFFNGFPISSTHFYFP